MSTQYAAAATSCAREVYKGGTNRSFRQAVDYPEGRRPDPARYRGPRSGIFKGATLPDAPHAPAQSRWPR